MLIFTLAFVMCWGFYTISYDYPFCGTQSQVGLEQHEDEQLIFKWTNPIHYAEKVKGIMCLSKFS